VRIVGGKFRGTALAPVGSGDEVARLRPTSDKVRESLFNILEHSHGNPVPGARVLDLFAGTGALGFEALSRGAERVLFVDDGVKSRALIRRNNDILRTTGQSKLYRRNATRMGENRGAAYGLVFLDPPYGKGLGETALASVLAGGWLAEGAVVVWEEGGAVEMPEGFELVDKRLYGETIVRLLEFKNLT